MSLVSDAGSRRSSAFCATSGVPLAESSSRYAAAAVMGAPVAAGARGRGAGAGAGGRAFVGVRGWAGAAAGSDGHTPATANAATATRRNGDMTDRPRKERDYNVAAVRYEADSERIDRQHA